jgi:hypothetical protein
LYLDGFQSPARLSINPVASSSSRPETLGSFEGVMPFGGSTSSAK